MSSEPHRTITTRLDHYCDEATFVDWEQDSPDVPGWQTNWRHLTADGKAAELTQPSAANQTRDFPPPVEAPGHRQLTAGTAAACRAGASGPACPVPCSGEVAA